MQVLLYMKALVVLHANNVGVSLEVVSFPSLLTSEGCLSLTALEFLVPAWLDKGHWHHLL